MSPELGGYPIMDQNGPWSKEELNTATYKSLQDQVDRYKSSSLNLEKEMLYYKQRYLNLRSVWDEADELLKQYSTLLDTVHDFFKQVDVDFEKIKSDEDIANAFIEIGDKFNLLRGRFFK